MTTLAETIAPMTEEELAAQNKKLLKQVAIKVAIIAGVTIAFHVGVNLLIRHLEKDTNDES